MKPAARDQDIPRGAGSGAPEARGTPGGSPPSRERTARRAQQPEKHRSDPPSRLPGPPPPGASTDAAGARFSRTDSAAAPSGSPRSKQREAAAGLSPLLLPQSPTPAPARPPACLPARLLLFLPSLPPLLAAARSSASAAAAAAPPSAPPPAHPPPPPRARIHVRCSATRGPAPCSRPVAPIGAKNPGSLRSWFVFRLVSLARGVNQVGMRLGNPGEGGRPKPAKAGFPGGRTKRRE